MTPYFIAYFLCGFVFMIISIIIKNRTWYNHLTSILGFGTILFLVAFRHPSMGTDLGYYTGIGYLASFEQIQHFSLDYVFHLSSFLNYEWGYIVFNKLISYINGSSQMLLISCAFVSLLPVGWVFYKKSPDAPFSLAVYTSLPCFLILFSGLRQGIAIGLCFFSLLFIENKHPVRFVLTVCLAALFHKSAFLFLAAYPIYYFAIAPKLRLWVTVPALFFTFILRVPLFKILSSLIKTDPVMDNNGAITLLLVFITVYILCTLYAKSDKRVNGYLNLFFCACFCQCFGGLYNTAIRVGYYFMIFLALLLPCVVAQLKDRWTALAIKTPAYLCFIGFALYVLKSPSWAMTNPYLFFWE